MRTRFISIPSVTCLRPALAKLTVVSTAFAVVLACSRREGEEQPVLDSSAATSGDPTTSSEGTNGPAGGTAGPAGPGAPAGPGGTEGNGTAGNGPGTEGSPSGTGGGTDVGAGGSAPQPGGNQGGSSGTDVMGTSGGAAGEPSEPMDGTGGNDGPGGSTNTGGTMGGSAGAGGESSREPGVEGDLCDVGVWDGSMPQPLELSGNTFAHDPTMVEANGTFYRFWTGDRVPSATSTDLLHWENAPTAYSGGYSPWVSEWLDGVPGQTFNFPWAPDVSYFNDQFHLYSSFSAKFGDNISCITHLTSDGPTPGNWTDHGPVICTEGNEPYNAIDADVALDTEGNAILSFGSFWDGIMAFPLNPDGSRNGSDLTHLAWAREIEAPVLLRRCGYYYLFVTWGLCCPGEGRSVEDLSYRVAVGRSENILGPYVDREGTPMLDGGGTLLLEGDGVQWAAAGHSDVVVSGSKIYHYYHAYRQSNGQAQLRIVELPFDDEGWPVPGGP